MVERPEPASSTAAPSEEDLARTSPGQFSRGTRRREVLELVQAGEASDQVDSFDTSAPAAPPTHIRPILIAASAPSSSGASVLTSTPSSTSDEDAKKAHHTLQGQPACVARFSFSYCGKKMQRTDTTEGKKPTAPHDEHTMASDMVPGRPGRS